ncbi:MAG: hypothetical protein JXR31_03925 [Prolixibacteraceae bacterium]|nr:hypothetical protein [Prolixibacteraceae bacterium]MBN2773371.1 hypothetical protein [Prolixibacteraceae bacterium]
MKDFYNFFSNHFYRRYLFISSFALLTGGFIYVFLRPWEPVFLNWLKISGLNNKIAALKENSLLLTNNLPEWIIYSLPGGLWAFAYSLIITGIWWQNRSRIKYFWISTIPGLVFGFEFLQLFKLIPGTFCFQDLALGFAGILSGFIFGILSIKHNNYEKEV